MSMSIGRKAVMGAVAVLGSAGLLVQVTLPAVVSGWLSSGVPITQLLTAWGAPAEGAGVVIIDTTGPSGEAAGTGMVLDSDGTVLTNYHVVEGSSTIEVTLSTGAQYSATVLGHSATSDIAVLQLADASGLATVVPDEDGVGIGQTVTGMGNANGAGVLATTSGQVTGLDETIQVSDEGSWASTTLTGLIETNTNAVPGDSGGPTYDAEGEVIGITSAGASSNQRTSARRMPTESVSYVIPIDTALQIVDQVLAGDESAGVSVGPNAWLGVSITDMRAGRGSQASGVGVISVEGPAALAGVAAGSILTTVDGAAISNTSAVSEVLAGHQPGDVVQLTWTDASGQQHTGTVTLGTSPIN